MKTLSLLSALLLGAAALAPAQTPGSADPAFGSVFNTEGSISQVVAQPDGGVLVLGSLSRGDGTATLDRLRRIDVNGNKDLGFTDGGFIADPRAVALQSDGRIVVVGTPNASDTRVSVERLTPAGQLDPAFVIASSAGFQPPVLYAVAIAPDGKIVVGGDLDNYDGAVRAALARLGPEGALDDTFLPDAGGVVAVARAFALAVQPDGKVLAAGNIRVGGSQSSGLVRLNADGTADTAFLPRRANIANPAPGSFAIALQADGNILFGGDFSAISGKPAPRIARFLPDGNLDPAFNPGAGPDGAVSSVAVQSDGKILLGGSFSNFNGVARRGVARLNADGSLDAAFDPGTGPGGTPTPDINSLALAPDGKVYVGGTFAGFGASSRDNLVRLLNDLTPPIAGITVPASANLWLAGQPDGSTASFGSDTAPAQSPVLVPGLTLNPTQSLTFAATGSVSNSPETPPTSSPDGGPYNGATFYTHNGENGIAPLTAPLNSLVGVFLADGAPDPKGSANRGLDYSTVDNPAGGVNYTGVQPRLGQPFFIGDGKDASGRPQQIFPPKGATRLFLGGFDGVFFYDNLGSFTVTVAPGGVDISNLRINEDVTSAASGASTKATRALIGDTITYTFHVRNTSGSPILGLVVSDVLPAHLTLVSVSDGGTLDGRAVTWKLGDFAPSGAGASRDLTLVVSVDKDAPINSVLNNRDYFAQAESYPTVPGLDTTVETTIVGPLEVNVTSNAATIIPGGTITYTFDVRNASGVTAKGVNVTVPLPASLQLVSAFFRDDKGKKIDATVSGGNLIYALGKLKDGEQVTLTLVAQVPYDANPKTPVVLPGPQITSKTGLDGQNSFVVADVTTPLSGAAPAAPPVLGLSKIVPDAFTLINLLIAQPQVLKDFKKALGDAASSNPALLATLQKNYPDLTLDALLSGDPTAIGAAIEPDVSFQSDDESGAVLTVNAPSPKQPETFITYALVFTNSGGASAENVVVQDRVPEGTEIVPGSVLINGQPQGSGAGGDVKFTDGKRTLRFTVGNLGPQVTKANGKVKGGAGFILYKVRVLSAGQGGLAAGSVIHSPGSSLATTSLARGFIGSPDGEDLTIVGPFGFYLESTAATSNAAPVNGLVSYDIYYKNAGGQKTNDFQIVDPVPAGASFAGATLLDDSRNPRAANPGKGESIDLPPVGATSGQVTFRLGKLKVNGDGFVRVQYTLLSALLAQKQPVLNHTAFVPASSFQKNAESSAQPVRAEAGVTRAGGIGTSAGSSNATRPLDPTIPRLFIAKTAPASVLPGETLTYTVVVGNLSDTAADQAVIFASEPVGAKYLSATGGDRAPVITSPGGQRQIAVALRDLAPHAARAVKLTFSLLGGTDGATISDASTFAQTTTTVAPLYAPPTFTFVLSQSQAAAFFSAQPLIGASALSGSGIAPSLVDGFVSSLTPRSGVTVLAGADAVSLNNGVLLIPLGARQLTAIGPAGLITNDGGSLITNDGGSIVAAGAGNLIRINGLIANDGGSLISNDGGSLLADLTSGAAGNIVAAGAGNILRGGGLNLIANDGGSLISNDGGSLTGVRLDQLITQDGGSLSAAGLSNVSSLILKNGTSLIANDGGSLVGNSGGTLLANQGGSVFAAGGANLATFGARPITSAAGEKTRRETATRVVGTPDASRAMHATPAGRLIVVGGGGATR